MDEGAKRLNSVYLLRHGTDILPVSLVQPHFNDSTNTVAAPLSDISFSKVHEGAWYVEVQDQASWLWMILVNGKGKHQLLLSPEKFLGHVIKARKEAPQGLPEAENLTLTDTFFLYASHSIRRGEEEESRHSVFPRSEGIARL
ncbi:hypothetical protein Salat_1891500 [Sesamum alatum]|uniref:Uncharacterized protein n=1 Tax=Sesamum alatum TaxID=300844 RepID=A0AAE1Y4E6_9LAMI|nr:hypothetical protein Salat_1891500 [Sesamum alatum]